LFCQDAVFTNRSEPRIAIESAESQKLANMTPAINPNKEIGQNIYKSLNLDWFPLCLTLVTDYLIAPQVNTERKQQERIAPQVNTERKQQERIAPQLIDSWALTVMFSLNIYVGGYPLLQKQAKGGAK
jgi:hypothetical protein